MLKVISAKLNFLLGSIEMGAKWWILVLLIIFPSVTSESEEGENFHQLEILYGLKPTFIQTI